MDKKWLCIVAVSMVAFSALAPASAQTEPPQCSDGVDNDNDGKIDHPEDPECDDANDDTEADMGFDGFATTVWIRYARKAAAFKGEVTSQRQECTEQRRLVLRHRTSEGTRTIARTFTNDRGHWEVYWPGARGRYFALVPEAEVLSSNGNPLHCQRDRSVRIRVGS